MDVKYTGPDEQTNFDVGGEIGSPVLSNGETYTVSTKLGKTLLDSSAWFTKADDKEVTS